MSPQYDGLAFRAIAFMKFATDSDQKSKFYSADPNSLIKSDLDALVAAWDKSDSFEPWEETTGTHFVLRAVAHKALVDGAAFAASLGQQKSAQMYAATAARISDSLTPFWNGKWIKATLGGKNAGKSF
jgi:glucoamylase